MKANGHLPARPVELKPFRRPRALLRPRALARLYAGRRYEDEPAALAERRGRRRAAPLNHSPASCALGWLEP